VAAQLPGQMQILYELHYVNAGDKDVDLSARVNVYTMPNEQVRSGIWGTQMRNEKLNLPPKAEKTEVSRCVLDKDVDVLLLATHTHALGRDAEALLFDGTATGAEVYRNNDWSQPKLQQFDKPLHVPAGQGFELRCHYANPNDHPVQYGFSADDEMCNLTMVFMPADPSITCKMVYQSDDGAQTP
jgi:hypothetical protein